MNDDLETASALALNRIFGYKPKISRLLIENFGSANAVFKAPDEEMAAIFGRFEGMGGEISASALEAAAAELEWLRRGGGDFLPITSGDYPSLLKECEDAPAGLYIRSTTPVSELFPDGPYISVVGTRDISLYGKEWCTRIVSSLSRAPSRPAIVSGFALGVDITAHLAALDSGLPTIAVIPVGIDDIYPIRHRRIADRLAATPGCAIVSDYPPGTGAQAFNFLRRNRIIAGMSQSTILIESKIHGGGMMTSSLAASYGRDVFALPGRIDDERSMGCNKLIADKVAEPIADLGLLQETLGLGRFRRTRKKDLKEEVVRIFSGRLDDESLNSLAELALFIKKNRGITTDGLCRETGMGYSDAAYFTGLLESEGIISIDVLQRCSINAKID